MIMPNDTDITISIHAPHARSDGKPYRAKSGTKSISIHAPHARSDQGPKTMECSSRGISIHAPHARSDHRPIYRPEVHRGYFNPRSSCEERPSSKAAAKTSETFQSTLLMRGATPFVMRCRYLYSYFNPRSSCEERPAKPPHCMILRAYFNPRSSCEERLSPPCISKRQSLFQSTLLMRGATIRGVARYEEGRRFQSTLLMRGATTSQTDND